MPSSRKTQVESVKNTSGASTCYILGGAGYIGSHVCAALLREGRNVVVIDDFSAGLHRRTDRLIELGNCQVLHCDVRDTPQLSMIFSKHGRGPVYHFAALKDAAASVGDAENYVVTNTTLLLSCIEAMSLVGLNQLIYSSTAAVYGEPAYLPIDTQHPLAPMSPYGAGKLVCENILRMALVRHEISSVLLRYFNPVGCGSDIELGYDYEAVGTVPIFPAIVLSVTDSERHLTIHKAPQPTRDGTTVRDFIHVSDLAEAHIAAESRLSKGASVETFNLGTGTGVSILEVLSTFETLLNEHPKYEMAPPRAGDVSQSFCNFAEAEKTLGWVPERTVFEMCKSELDAARRYG